MISGIFAQRLLSRTDPSCTFENTCGSATTGSNDSRAYHYQGADGSLRFRYDNAQHRPPVVSTVHKHVGQDLVPGEGVTLVDVLREIVGRYLKP